MKNNMENVSTGMSDEIEPAAEPVGTRNYQE